VENNPTFQNLDSTYGACLHRSMLAFNVWRCSSKGAPGSHTPSCLLKIWNLNWAWNLENGKIYHEF
jgi:hypothetical protein